MTLGLLLVTLVACKELLGLRSLNLDRLPVHINPPAGNVGVFTGEQFGGGENLDAGEAPNCRPTSDDNIFAELLGRRILLASLHPLPSIEG